MTGLPHPNAATLVEGRVPDDATLMLTFTNRGERALDALATVLIHRMARTPQGIADVLERVYRADVDELCTALDAIATELRPNDPAAEPDTRSEVDQ